MVNVYPGDLLPLSYSCVHSTSLPEGSDSSLKLTLRLKEHLLYGWIRSTGDATLHAYTDKGHYLSFYPSFFSNLKVFTFKMLGYSRELSTNV